MRSLARHLLLSALALAMLACKHAPGIKPESAAATAKPGMDKPAVDAAAKPGDIPPPAKPGSGGPFAAIFRKPGNAKAADTATGAAVESDGTGSTQSKPEGAQSKGNSPAKKTGDAVPEPTQTAAGTMVEPKAGEIPPPAKAKKSTLFAGLFGHADAAKAKPAAPKKPGFHWPWSKAKPAGDEAATIVADTPAPKPEAIPYGLPATPLVEIKPREPETSLAPAATAPPAGKKANPIDDIGLYPEQ